MDGGIVPGGTTPVGDGTVPGAGAGTGTGTDANSAIILFLGLTLLLCGGAVMVRRRGRQG